MFFHQTPPHGRAQGRRKKHRATSEGWWLLCNKDPGATDTSPHSPLPPTTPGLEVEHRVAGARRALGTCGVSIASLHAGNNGSRRGSVRWGPSFSAHLCHPVDCMGLCCGLAAAGLGHGQC